jgi:protein-tyrosine-phosphatase
MLDIAGEYGIDLSSHRSRPLSSVDAAGLDLVLGLARAHVAAAVVDGGVPRERAFTLAEIVRLLESIVPPEEDDLEKRARAAVARADEARSSSLEFIPGEDVEDPIGGPPSGYADMAVIVRELCLRLLHGLFGPDAVRPPPHSPGGKL